MAQNKRALTTEELAEEVAGIATTAAVLKTFLAVLLSSEKDTS